MFSTISNLIWGGNSTAEPEPSATPENGANDPTSPVDELAALELASIVSSDDAAPQSPSDNDDEWEVISDEEEEKEKETTKKTEVEKVKEVGRKRISYNYVEDSRLQSHWETGFYRRNRIRPADYLYMGYGIDVDKVMEPHERGFTIGSKEDIGRVNKIMEKEDYEKFCLLKKKIKENTATEANVYEFKDFVMSFSLDDIRLRRQAVHCYRSVSDQMQDNYNEWVKSKQMGVPEYRRFAHQSEKKYNRAFRKKLTALDNLKEKNKELIDEVDKTAELAQLMEELKPAQEAVRKQNHSKYSKKALNKSNLTREVAAAGKSRKRRSERLNPTTCSRYNNNRNHF